MRSVMVLLVVAGSIARAGTLGDVRARSAPPSGTFLPGRVSVEDRTFPYAVWLPPGYDSTGAPLPVILALHGAGSRGSDGIRQRRQSIAEAAQLYPERYPAILVLPQIPPGARWEGPMLEMALAALDSTVRHYRTDRSRTYLVGQSLGGDGVFALASRAPGRFAAMIVAAIGGGRPDYDPARLRSLPVRVFHGELDRIPVARAAQRVRQLRDAGSRAASFTAMPGRGHDIFDEVYRDPAVAEWLFRQRLGR